MHSERQCGLGRAQDAKATMTSDHVTTLRMETTDRAYPPAAREACLRGGAHCAADMVHVIRRLYRAIP